MSFEDLKKKQNQPQSTTRRMKPTSVTLEEPEEGFVLLVRNNSRRAVMEALMKRLVRTEVDVSGRYLKIGASDVPALANFASEGGFFVKTSKLPGAVVYDIMVDRDNRPDHHRHDDDED